jgi:sporulation related protein
VIRGLLIALVVANLLVLAWSFDALPGFSRPREREPERLQRQVSPQAVQLITPTAASAALQAAAAQRSQNTAAVAPAAPAAAAPAPATDGPGTVCLEAGPFATAEVATAERGLRDLKLQGLEWTQQRSERGGSYIVYQGRFADEAAVTRRRNELQRQQISTEELRNSPDLQPGLSFGRFDTRAAADAALARLQQQGIKPTRVVTIHIPIVVTLLRVERADGALAARLTQLNLPPAGSGFRPCASPP